MPFIYETQLTYKYFKDKTIIIVFKNNNQIKKKRVIIINDDVDLSEVINLKNE